MFHKKSEVAFWGKTMPNLSSVGKDLGESPKENDGGNGEIHGKRWKLLICEKRGIR